MARITSIAEYKLQVLSEEIVDFVYGCAFDVYAEDTPDWGEMIQIVKELIVEYQQDRGVSETNEPLHPQRPEKPEPIITKYSRPECHLTLFVMEENGVD